MRNLADNYLLCIERRKPALIKRSHCPPRATLLSFRLDGNYTITRTLLALELVADAARQERALSLRFGEPADLFPISELIDQSIEHLDRPSRLMRRDER